MFKTINFIKISKRLFSYKTYLKEPKEYRTIYIKDLPIDWEEDEIRVKLEQIGPIEKLLLIKNSLGLLTGRGIYLIIKLLPDIVKLIK
jgi:hypothetical protein